jgi:endoglucanase
VERERARHRQRPGDTRSRPGGRPDPRGLHIPQRDCRSHAPRGAASVDAYRAWIRGVADGLGAQTAVIVLEPDALAQLDCLTDQDRRVRLSLLADAVGVLTARTRAIVYLDAGHSGWVAAAEMGRRLRAAGITRARGFSLNVSNTRWTSGEVAYVRALSRLVPGAHAVIDTGRNGVGPAPGDEWCNPAGRALGPPPTTATPDPLVDAYLWIKPPGESDGLCQEGPAPGVWWPSYALGLAERAAT